MAVLEKHLVMFRNLLLSFILLLLFSQDVLSQNSGDNIFDSSVLHEIHITFPEQNFQRTLDRNFGDIESHPREVSYRMVSVTIDGETVDSVGIRIKGYSSTFDKGKDPFKIDFNKFVPGKRYDGLRKINLNNGIGDPGLQREMICYDMMNRMGVDAPRTSYARVFINGEFFAVYILVEQVDKEFLKNNFNNSAGTLFKATSNIGYREFGRLQFPYDFELKTNKESNDFSPMTRLEDVLNDTPDADFPEAIQEIFNVDRFLKTLAVDVATNNWNSNLSYSGGNWYLYEDPSTGKLQWIPWDFNLALGSEFYLLEYHECTPDLEFVVFTNGTPTVQVYHAGANNLSVYRRWTLDTITLEIDELAGKSRQVITHTFPEVGGQLIGMAAGYGDLCGDWTDFEYDIGIRQYVNAPVVVNGDLPNGPDLAFAVLLNENWTLGCRENWSEECADRYSSIQARLDTTLTPEGSFQKRNIQINQRLSDSKLTRRILEVPTFYNSYLNHFCNLMENIFLSEYYDTLMANNQELIYDAVMNSPNKLSPFHEFEWELSPEGMPKYLSDRITNLRAQLESLNATCDSGPTSGIPLGAVVINEFVADNDSTSTISDPAGSFPDWIELYNNTDATINLSGAFLSDKSDNLDKWEFPDGASIPANGYLIIWADEDQNEDGLHVNFKLSKNGEAIYLSNAGDSSRIDEVVFGPQETNVSMSRLPNGSGDFVAQHATHGFNNEALAPNISVMDVVINEFVANSDTTGGRSAEACCASDWIELYNNTGTDIDLSGACLSNAPDDILKWRLPEDTYIIADSSLIVWADGGEDGEGLHANFILDKNGGAIYFSNAVDSTRIDEVAYEAQEVNNSLSRVPNGTGDFIVQHVTRGYSNDTPVGNRNVASSIYLSVHPNPAGDFLSVRFPGAAAGAMQVDLYAVTGRVIFSGREVSDGTLELDLNGLSPGLYFLRVRDVKGRMGTVKFVKR
jgi:hypothetical protein